MTVWTPEAVMNRFAEAADTERRSPQKGMAMARTCWPAYAYEKEDINGWTDEDRQDEMERWAHTKGAKADAVSRYDECVRWGLELIPDNKTRQIVWTWAFCTATPKRSFAKDCKRNGWARPTAYRRLTRAMEQISASLANDRVLLRESARNWLRQEALADVSVNPSSDNSASAPLPPTPAAYRAEKSVHTLKTPEAVIDFVAYLEKANDRSRRERLRRFGADA